MAASTPGGRFQAPIATAKLPPLIAIGICVAQVLLNWFVLIRSVEVSSVTTPWLMNHGYTLFDTVIDFRGPIREYFLSFAQWISGLDPITLLRVLSALMTIGALWLTYRLAILVSNGNAWAGVASITFLALWQAQMNYIVFYYDEIVALCLLAAAFLWIRLEDSRRAWIRPLGVGILLGVAGLVRQTAIVAIPILGLWIIFSSAGGRRRWMDLGWYVVGIAAPHLAVAAVAIVQGAFAGYFYWTWQLVFAGLGLTNVTSDPTWWDVIYIALMSTGSLFFVVYHIGRGPRHSRVGHWGLIVALPVASLIPILRFPAYRYLGVALPLLAVMTGISLCLSVTRKNRVALGILLVVFAISARANWGAFRNARDTHKPGGLVAYDELQPLAANLVEVIAPGKTFYMFPATESTAQLYVLTDRLPSGTVYLHPWFLCNTPLVDQVIASWKHSAPPDYFLVFPQTVSAGESDYWGACGRHQIVMDYVEENYVPLETFPETPYIGPTILYRLK